MKNVTREAKPAILNNEADKWTAELMVAVEKYRNTGKKVPSVLQNRYRKIEIKDALKRMYSDEDGNNFCCYCESEIDVVDYPHIEHKKPKDPDFFPEKTYEWENLHLACTKCNGNKSNKWDAVNPILDAVDDTPIDSHLSFIVDDTTGVYRSVISSRGKTTIEHADLNRSKLRTARKRIYLEILKVIQEIVRLKDNPRAFTHKEILINKSKGPHGALIQWALNEWGVT